MVQPGFACEYCNDSNSRPVRIHRLDGKGEETVRNGAVRTAEYTSIRVPLLGLVADGDVKSSIFSGASSVASGKPRRPFGGSPPPAIFRKFLVPVFPNMVSGQAHIHSVPEWDYQYDQWILAVPFQPRVDDLEHLPQWTSTYMTQGAHFEKKAIDELKKRSRIITADWIRMSKTNPDFVRQVKQYLATWEKGMTLAGSQSRLTKTSYRSNRTCETDTPGIDNQMTRLIMDKPNLVIPLEQRPALIQVH
ncbi:hypothetical protein MIND_01358200 [Mycena indigotica]|uniref:Uncharacterized protein n=1 Tax=Mycena indigotica TaxID=2126181 RepID=A0A8H6S023_9AGAR|nr:uncharacterized protein MIND_01358200 [Mycena indigotica]KAF7289838.1 hypothetical protein MIND_01358200 [Mycena indigotica]